MSNSTWPSMRELKQAAGEGPCFVAKLVRPTKPADMYPGAPKHEEVCLSGPLDADLFERLRTLVFEVWGEQLDRTQTRARDRYSQDLKLREGVINSTPTPSPTAVPHDCEKAAPPGLLIRMNCKAGERWTCPCGKPWVHVCDEAEGCRWEEGTP